MTSPLAPPPPTGNPIDRWLYLLWRKLTATGQLFWSAISPGTSADVAAVVTDETGSPGALVFATNPTLTGVTIDGFLYQGDTTAVASPVTLGAIFSTNTASGNSISLRKSVTAANNTASLGTLRSRGTNAAPTALVSADNIGAWNSYGYDGAGYINAGNIIVGVDNTVSTGIVPGNLQFRTGATVAGTYEGMRVDSTQTVTLGGAYTAPALKVIPVASQNRSVTVTGSNSGNPTIGVSGGNLACSAALVLSQTTLLETSVALTNGAGAAAGTLLNAPAVGNPTKWIPINDNGTVRYIPAW